MISEHISHANHAKSEGRSFLIINLTTDLYISNDRFGLKTVN